MTFPFYISLGPWTIHPHSLFDIFAYLVAGRLYFFCRNRTGLPALPLEQNLWLLVGMLVGAAIGAKVLAWMENPSYYWAIRDEPAFWIGGKTIVGGILGGWAGVELAKAAQGIHQTTGDVFVYPLLAGIAIGRLGCFLSGLADGTHGLPSSLPWTVDFGDGIPRHPAQLYEAGFAFALAGVLLSLRRVSWPAGARFRIAIGAYLLFRFFIEFIKPHPTIFLGLSTIQLASLIGSILCFRWLFVRRNQIWPTALTNSTS